LGPKDVLTALLTEIGDSSELETAFVVRAWATKLCERTDWPQLLKERVGKVTLQELLVSALVAESGGVLPTGDMFDEVGIDPDRGRKLAGKAKKFDREDIEEARAKLLARKLKQNNAPLVEQVAQAAAKAADDIDF
jgi:hypothetical protein